MKHGVAALLVLGSLLLPLDAAAQPGVRRQIAIAAAAAPVYVLPDATRTPLRVLTPGTRLRILRDQGDWLRVEFDDPQWGPRVGYIERKNVQISESEPESPAPAPPLDPGRAAPPKPRPRPSRKPKRAWLDGNVGIARAGTEDYRLTAVRQINGQPATFQADYHLPVGLAIDAGGGVLVAGRLGIGVSLSTTRQEDPASLSIEIPHPILSGPNATATATSRNTFARRETGIHIHAAYVPATTDPLTVRVFGGPSYFRVQQDAVEDIRYRQDFLPFDPANEVEITGELVRLIPYDEANGWGFHVGLDAGWFYTPAVGIGFTGRYSRGQVEIVDPLAGATVDLDVGGFQLGAGVRVRF